MPVKRSYEPIELNVTDGGRLLPDLPPSRIGPSNYDEKINFRRQDAEEIKIEGWDYPAPEPASGWFGDGITNFHDGLPAEAVRQVRRANGAVAVVGCGHGFIKYFDYDANEWVTIGSGYSRIGDTGYRYWRIEDIASYAVFNNGRDLPCTWQIGDAAVVPIYELREAGYASVGDICGFNGILRCADVLEINDDAMESVMTDPLPYKTIVDNPDATRINYRQIWSNINNPRDFAANVLGSITASSNTLTIDWPMASLAIGDIIYVVGAGTEGGNLRTEITNISGTTITLEDPAITTVADAFVFKETALETIVGYNDLGDDGSAIVRQEVLKNRMVSFKAGGHIYEEYYNGDLEQPFIAEQMTRTPRALRFPRAVANVQDRYLLFPADRHFYRYSIGSQELEEDPVLRGAEKTLFFSRVVGLGPYDVWCADNACTGEIYFAYPAPTEIAVPTFYNTEQTACNTCPDGYDGEVICRTVEAGRYDSPASQAHADALALAAAQAEADAARADSPCLLIVGITISARTRSGTASLVGCPEFGTPSSPDRYYREAHWEGYSDSRWSGSFGSNCNSVVPLDHAVYDGHRHYDPVTGVVTLSGQNTFNGVPVSTGTDCGHPPDEGCGGQVPIGFGTITRGEILSPTHYRAIDDPSYCCTRTAPLGSILYSIEYEGLRDKTLDDEDLESDAIERFRNANPYGAWEEVATLTAVPSPTPLSCCPTSYRQRTSGRDIAYEESDAKVDVSGLAPDAQYRISVEITRTDLVTSESIISGYQEIEETANGLGQISEEFTMPVTVGYGYEITNVDVEAL
jgi:hypothetical protein